MITFTDAQVGRIYDALGNARQLVQGPHMDEHAKDICLQGASARLEVLANLLKQGEVESE